MRVAKIVCLSLLLLPVAVYADFYHFSVVNISSSRQTDRLSNSWVTGESEFPAFQSDSVLHTSVNELDFHRQIAIGVDFDTLGKQSQPYIVEWFFIAETNSRQKWVFDGGSKRVEINAGPGNGFNVASTILDARKLTTTTYNLNFDETGNDPSADPVTGMVESNVQRTVTTSGSKIYGWIVRLKQGDRVIETQASLSELKQMADQISPQLDKIAAAASQTPRP